MTILGKTKVCKDKAQKKDTKTKQCISLQEKDCCSNQSFVNTGDDTIKKAYTELEAENILFLNTFYYTYVNLFEGLEENIVPFLNYNTPLIPNDFQVLHEVFLI